MTSTNYYISSMCNPFTQSKIEFETLKELLFFRVIRLGTKTECVIKYDFKTSENTVYTASLTRYPTEKEKRSDFSNFFRSLSARIAGGLIIVSSTFRQQWRARIKIYRFSIQKLCFDQSTVVYPAMATWFDRQNRFLVTLENVNRCYACACMFRKTMGATYNLGIGTNL